MLGGDHSIAVGTVAGVSRFFRDNDRESGNDRPALDRRARRHEYAAIESQRQRAWDAAGVLRRRGAGFAGRDVRLLRRKWIRRMWLWSAFAMWTCWSAATVRDTGVRAFTMRDIDERGMRAGDG